MLVMGGSHIPIRKQTEGPMVGYPMGATFQRPAVEPEWEGPIKLVEKKGRTEDLGEDKDRVLGCRENESCWETCCSRLGILKAEQTGYRANRGTKQQERSTSVIYPKYQKGLPAHQWTPHPYHVVCNFPLPPKSPATLGPPIIPAPIRSPATICSPITNPLVNGVKKYAKN